MSTRRLQLPRPFINTIVSTFPNGEGWLNRLPGLLKACASRWLLTIHPPFDLSFNYVARATRLDGTEVVLKLGVPNPELWTEIEALRHYAGDGFARLIDVAPKLGAFLIEHLEPGTPLANITDDEQATAIAAAVMQKLWKPAPPEGHTFPTVERWARGLEGLRDQFGGGTGPFPSNLVDLAENYFDEMINSQGEPVLLHGDLHHWNILQSTRQPWLAIDPKGVIGEREYETGAFLRNPYTRLTDPKLVTRLTERRASQLAEILGFDRQRILKWAAAQAVLSAWWAYDDLGEEWLPWFGIAEGIATAR